MRRLALAALLGLCACADDPDAGVDASLIDTGTALDLDGGGTTDASPADAAPRDGEPADGPLADLGPFDGGELDAEPGDGAPLDAEPGDGPPNDGAPGDADDLDADPGRDLPVGPDTGADAGLADAAPADASPYNPPPSSFEENTVDTNFRHGQAVRVVDIDGDGDRDIVAALSLTDTLRLYVNGGNALGGGDGSVFAAHDVSQLGSVVAVASAVADFDGDGDLDLAVAGLFNRTVGFPSTGDVIVFSNPGNPLGVWLGVPVSIQDLWGMISLTAADLSGDGRPDLIVGCNQVIDPIGNVVGNGVYWFRNINGTGFTVPQPIDTVLAGVEVVEAADVDLDGVPDLVASSRLDGEVVWFENGRLAGQSNNNPSFTRHRLAVANLASGFALGQIDPDASPELVLINDDGVGGRVAWFDAPADPRNLWNPITLDGGFGGTGAPMRVTFANLNRDAFLDVAIASAVHSTIRTYVRQPMAQWQQVDVAGFFQGAGFIAAGDIDNDGDDDLVTSTYENDPSFDRITWWRTQP